jgi:hypothetical protein
MQFKGSTKRTAISTIIAIVVTMTIVAAETPMPGFAHAQSLDVPPIVQTRLAGQHIEESTTKGQSSPPRGNAACFFFSIVYDEQLGTTFTQDFTSMLYYVTAVAQTDPASGTGPAYLLNGLSRKCFTPEWMVQCKPSIDAGRITDAGMEV